jgi:alpha-amylase
VGSNKPYFDDARNKQYLDRVVEKCYNRANRMLIKLIEDSHGRFKVSFSITGVLLEQLEKWHPETLELFKALVDTGCVEMFNETYYHSLSYLISKEEFVEQVELHRKRIKELFGVKAKVFRNTEAMYCNELAKVVQDLGYKAVIAEGLDHILQWRSPNYLYKAKDANITLFLRNYKLSDDVAFRFSEHTWSEFPLTAEKYAAWLAASDGEIVNIFMDYETFGEHQWPETGIFQFLEHLPKEVGKYENLSFVTPSEALKELSPVGEFDVPYLSSWADINRDLSAWLENKMQHKAFNDIKALESKIKACGDPTLLDIWRKLQTSDHFYYMCTKWFSDGDVHKYFNYYETPYDAFLNYMNVLRDLRMRVDRLHGIKQSL